MPGQTQPNNQQTIMYALIAIAVLLALIVGFMIYQQTHAVPSPTVSGSTSGADSQAANIASQMPSSSAAPAPFDAKTATKLPAGMTPQQAMDTYSKDVTSQKYADAYNLLPLAQKQSYGSADAYGSQIGQYGITGFKTGKPTTSGSDTTIVQEEDTAQMNITYTWVFTKNGNTWFVKSRTMGGALQ